MTATLIAPPDFLADKPAAPGPRLVDSTDTLQESTATRDVRVLVADGQALVRAGYLALLRSEAGIAVASEATTGDEAVALARRTCPEVALIDANLPGLDSVEVTRQIALLEAFVAAAGLAIAASLVALIVLPSARAFLPRLRLAPSSMPIH
jgi:CheY-like chemotaxis protein